jgi:hypothetical protein
MNDLERLLNYVVPQIPLYAIWTVGIVIALRRWRTHPQVSLVILLGLGPELVRSVCKPLADYWFTREMQMAVNTTGELLIARFTILERVLGGLDILAWILILVALFRWRHLPTRLLGHDGQYLPESFLTRDA